ncbi:hypothetical protein [Labilibaculum euxinus]
MNIRIIFFLLLAILIQVSTYAQKESVPEKGFVSWLPATKWEDASLIWILVGFFLH